jgi:hypothetical protein
MDQTVGLGTHGHALHAVAVGGGAAGDSGKDLIADADLTKIVLQFHRLVPSFHIRIGECHIYTGYILFYFTGNYKWNLGVLGSGANFPVKKPEDDGRKITCHGYIHR